MKDIIINTILTIGVLFIIVCIAILGINQMEERIRDDCLKQNNTGIISYGDFEINCEAFIDGIDAQMIQSSGELAK